MAKIEITIMDLPNGKVAIRYTPPLSELKEVNTDQMTAAMFYAGACAEKFTELSKAIQAEVEQGRDEKSVLWTPKKRSKKHRFEL